MQRINIELKARDPGPAATLARCHALGAEDRGVLVQKDTYYAARRGRLKLREHALGEAVLIAYHRADTTEPEASAYTLVPVGDAAILHGALDEALGTVVVVTKHRRLFVWENVRIHLDQVEGLGTFVELEALVGAGRGDAELARARIERLRSELAIEDGSLIAVGYADLLLDGPEALLRAAQGAMRNAYAPYSQFRVGAALRSASGAIHVGANVENAAYPQGQCAEASALGAMVAAGETAISAVAVVAERALECAPCGGCRQRLSEFGGPHTPVYLGRPGLVSRTTTLAELLPLSFGPEDLAR